MLKESVAVNVDVVSAAGGRGMAASELAGTLLYSSRNNRAQQLSRKSYHTSSGGTPVSSDQSGLSYLNGPQTWFWLAVMGISICDFRFCINRYLDWYLSSFSFTLSNCQQCFGFTSDKINW